MSCLVNCLKMEQITIGSKGELWKATKQFGNYQQLKVKIFGNLLRCIACAYLQRTAEKIRDGAGHVLEKHLGLPITSSRRPNAGSWELKLISLKYLKSGDLTVKETMSVTQITPDQIMQNNFEHSHLLAKLRRVVIGARIWESTQEEKSIFYGVTIFDLLDNPEVYNQIKADYDLVRGTIRAKGISALKSGMGKYIQPRTKGSGQGSTSRAFYARRSFLNKFILPLLSQ